MSTLSEKREEVWFWGIFSVLGLILALIGWLRALGLFAWLKAISLFGMLLSATAAASAPPPLHPVPAIDAIVAALRAHDVVGMDTGHNGAEHELAFLVALISDPRVAEAGVDISYEGLSARYQGAMDRYVAGDNVDARQLAPIWNETTQQQIPGPIWTGEVPRLFQAVRSLNASLPVAKRIRVLLGDPPIEWEGVHTAQEFQAWLAQRDSFPAEVIRTEVLAQKRHALALFGGGHLQRKQQASNYQMESPLAQTVVSLLERDGASTFVIRTRASESATQTWPIPSLATIRGTDFGAAPEPQGSLSRMKIVDGRLLPLPREEWISMRQEDQFDAILYLGIGQPPAPPNAAAICADPEFVRVRLARMAISGLPPSVPERLRTLCAK